MYLGCVRDARGVALCLGSLHCPQVETVALDHNQKHQTPADRSPQDHSAGLRTVALRKKQTTPTVKSLCITVKARKTMKQSKLCWQTDLGLAYQEAPCHF